MPRIAIIDDDVYIGNMLEEVLTKEGYLVSRAYSGTEAVLLLNNSLELPDLILLDLMLPGLSGEQVLEKIKASQAADIPVIVISAKVDIEEKVHILLDGAADYLTKPFDTKELLARITVQLRQRACRADSQKTDNILIYSDLAINLSTYEALVSDKKVKLTKTEFAILKLLMLNPKQVITKTVMLDRISEDTPDCMESSLKVHMSNLRKKLKCISNREYIEAVWGIGFKMKDI